MLIFGAAVIINRNPVASALSLVVSFLGLAALFISLGAFFIGIIQVLVYAGAVMVLFLFIIMLLDLRAERLRRINWIAFAGGSIVALAFSGSTFYRDRHDSDRPARLFRLLPDRRRMMSIASERLLFSNYNLPFQIIGLLVLVATIGVVVLSKRETAVNGDAGRLSLR